MIPVVVTELARRGHHVVVAVLGPSDHAGWDVAMPAVRVGPLPQGWEALRGSIPRVLGFVVGLLHKERPQIVIVTEPVGAVLASVARLLVSPWSRPSLASWVHGDPRACRHAWALRFCDGDLALSAGAASVLRSRFGRESWVVYNPVEIPARACPRPRADQPPEFLYIGRIDPGKGLDRILRALARVGNAPWRLQVVGDGALRRQASDLASLLGIAPRITWTGWVANPWAEVASASALLLASDSEGFPTVLLEAIARGVPLISMDCDFGPREIIEPGANGWLVAKGDEQGLATILGDLCAGRRNLPSAKDVLRTAERFRVESVVTRVQDGLIEICGGGGHWNRSGSP